MKRTILIIEDDIIFSRSISNWLKKNNMETECVTHLSSARRKLSSGEYDLVLADLRLPDGNSTELLRWIREINLNVPFLIMTNYGKLSLQARTTGQAAGGHWQGLQPYKA